MRERSVSIDRLFFGHEYWSSDNAIDEIEVYCELLDHLQDKIEALDTRGKDEEVTLFNVQAVLSSYAIEIAMKSLWALDHPDESIPHTHNLADIFDQLEDETKKSLEGLRLNRQVLGRMPTPFTSNRYSMEHVDKETSVYKAPFLRDVTQLLEDKLEENREALLQSADRLTFFVKGPLTRAEQFD